VERLCGVDCGHWGRRWRRSLRVSGGSPTQDGDDKQLTCLRWEKGINGEGQILSYLYSRQVLYRNDHAGIVKEVVGCGIHFDRRWIETGSANWHR